MESGGTGRERVEGKAEFNIKYTNQIKNQYDISRKYNWLLYNKTKEDNMGACSSHKSVYNSQHSC